VTLHRLNRVEYNNTIRDLMGTALRPADDFPADDRGFGFDNVADILSLSPLHIEMYQRAAEQLVNEALAGAQRTRLIGCDLAAGGDACARTSLAAFARRAWRRPVTDAEVDRLMTAVALARSKGDSYDQGMNLALQAVLISPSFVFRVEIDPSPTSLTPHPLNSHEVASRLSYFLWSTMPDDELFAAADAGALLDPAVVRGQVTRMLASAKATALVDNFAGQWLYTRKIDEAQPDAATFPGFDAPLRAAMKKETELLFSEMAFRGLPADRLLTADFTFLNDRLARHYGLPAVGSADFKRVTLTGDQRIGFLSHAGILTVTSHPTRTSPVLRGKWVLNELLCEDIPPPPPGVDTKIDTEVMPTGSLRQRLEQHRTNPECAACHNLMDSIGFGLENYDAIGAYRTTDAGFAVDSSGAMPDGTPFSGTRELAALVGADPGFARCMTHKLYTYALGRAPDMTTKAHMDPYILQTLIQGFTGNGFKVSDLIAGIVTSDTFLKRRGEPAAAGGAP
jgi:hypothetical protein